MSHSEGEGKGGEEEEEDHEIWCLTSYGSDDSDIGIVKEKKYT